MRHVDVFCFFAARVSRCTDDADVFFVAAESLRYAMI